MEFQAVVAGAGHAGCEAALACARMGFKTLLLTMNIESLAFLACNPSIGGTAKGHLVREVDALGGEMGLAIDDVFIQSRMINTGKGPAVHSLRAQADKRAYHDRMLRTVRGQEGLTLRQGEISRILVANGKVVGVETDTGMTISCRAVVVASGVYLRSRVIMGERIKKIGPSGFERSVELADCLRDLGFSLRKFKTGTPARVDGRTVDFSKLEEQPGDREIQPFSFLNEEAGFSFQGYERGKTSREDYAPREQVSCFLGYTNERTHEIIRQNLHRAPMVSGLIEGVGARYCPSIEDKVIRFAQRERHPFFLEPEGLNDIEWYVQGTSTSMPADVQEKIYHSLPGLENAEIVRLAYAIEYDVIDSLALRNSLQAKEIDGLFFAGQINGTSGYEEAAAQGIYAGVNAALFLKGDEPFFLGRDQAYIGVLVDDLTTKGTNEPYRMMTSRAEYRLLIRQDNADLRLTESGYRVGLCGDERYRLLCEKRDEIDGAMRYFDKHVSERQKLKQGETIGQIFSDQKKPFAIRRESARQVELMVKYEGYILRQVEAVEKFRRMEDVKIPSNLDFLNMEGLRIEAKEKLARLRPETLGAASRIPGVSPGDISLLMIRLRSVRRGQNAVEDD